MIQSVHNPTRIILYIFGALFCVIASSAFALSYTNLVSAASAAGIPDEYAPLWPLCLDAFLVTGSLFILRGSLLNESTLPGWIVLIVFTGVSTAFNVMNGPQSAITQAAHAVPPIALCVDLELLMTILKSDLKRTSQELNPVTNSVESRADKIGKIDPEEVERIKKYFEEYPDSSINKARLNLHLGREKVESVYNEFISSKTARGIE